MADYDRYEVTEDDFQAVAQWVFVRTLADLRNRIENPELAGDRYQMLGIAPILRKLLIDGGNLVQAVNRRYRLQLTFEMAPFSMPERELHATITRGFRQPVPPLNKLGYWRIYTPGSLIPTPGNPGSALGLAHFLAAHVGVERGHRLSVKELVQFYCIVEGGVHIGKPRRPYEKDLLALVPTELSMAQDGVDDSPIGSLYVCGEIALRGLEPLLAAVQEDPVLLTRKPDLIAISRGKPRHRRG